MIHLFTSLQFYRFAVPEISHLELDAARRSLIREEIRFIRSKIEPFLLMALRALCDDGEDGNETLVTIWILSSQDAKQRQKFLRGETA